MPAIETPVSKLPTPVYFRAAHKRAKRIRGELGPFQTSAVSMEKGRERPIEIDRITPGAIIYRVRGLKGTYTLPHAVAHQRAVAIAADYDCGPRRHKRISRGAIGGTR